MMKIGIVGPCGAGKTTLAQGLLAMGYDAHDCAQEHSDAQAMWQRITQPDILIFLDASVDTIHTRLNVHWEPWFFARQGRRLEHARAHADLFIDTNLLTREQVLERCLRFLKEKT